MPAFFHRKKKSLAQNPASPTSSTSSVPNPNPNPYPYPSNSTLTTAPSRSTQPSSAGTTPPAHFTPGYKIQPEDIRQLTELIRLRYRTDLDIWGARSVPRASYSDVEGLMQKSDEILRRIEQMIEWCDRRDLFGPEEDWVKFLDIKERIGKPGKARWADNPPWNDPDRHKYD